MSRYHFIAIAANGSIKLPNIANKTLGLAEKGVRTRWRAKTNSQIAQMTQISKERRDEREPRLSHLLTE